ncbi:MAG: hypothetical protein JKY94_17525 [Rhodobacteraceae bacterium]|nr:hypothetical protein [Paracoccaceae bacterium]
MADATPVFQSKGNLQSVLRLSGMGANTDADEQLDSAIREARTFFWRRLGKARLDELAGLAFVDPPVTDNDHLRQLCSLVENKRVRWYLIPLYTSHFKDGGAAMFQEWNEEAAFRNLNPFAGERLRETLMQEIEDDMDMLAGEDSAGAETTIQATTFGMAEADGPPAILGQSLLDGGIFNGIS